MVGTTTGEERAEECIRALIAFLIECRSYLSHLAKPLPVRVGVVRSGAAHQRLLNSICHELQVVAPILQDKLTNTVHTTAFEDMVSSRIVDLLQGVACEPESGGLIDLAVEEAKLQQRGEAAERLRVIAHDGVQLDVRSRGVPGSKAVVIIGPCGIPTAILNPWLLALSKEHHVLAYESRGFSAQDIHAADLALGLDAQVQDVFSTMSALGVQRAHLMGVCGGAVTALRSAQACPDRVESLSLWHGDYNVDDCLTRYQQDLRWLMKSASGSRQQAASFQGLLNDRNAIARVRPDMAHLLFFPYSTVELLYRYARASSAIMEANVLACLGEIRQPVLLITSELDQTAHPKGSKYVAERLPRATLVMAEGEHLTCFKAHPAAQDMLSSFIREAALG